MEESDARLAARIAAEAGGILRDIRTNWRDPADSAGLGKAGDVAANAYLIAALARARPDDAVLSEEAEDNPARLSCRRLWVIDPLDGTREYAAHSSEWAVHVGLAIDGAAAVGAVALPDRGETYTSDDPRALRAARSRPRIVVSRSRAPEESVAVARALDGECFAMGSAGAKAMAVLRGDAEIYLHSGGQYVWDNCAPAAVALAAGLHVSRIDGEPLRYNCADAYVPDLLIAHPDWATRALAAIAMG